MNPAFIIPEWGAPANVAALSSTRFGGVSPAPYDDGVGGGGLNPAAHVGDDELNVVRNRAILVANLPAEPIWLNQVHGVAVLDASMAAPGATADAIISTQPGHVCAIQTADCLPVLFADAAGRVIGAAHGGWRGLAGGILENTVARMREAGAAELHVWLGPAIGPNQFEVGADVREAFLLRHEMAGQAFLPIADRPGKFLADIYQLARLLLQALDVTRISGGDCCTVSDARFYSYRRDRITGRMASMVWIKGSG